MDIISARILLPRSGRFRYMLSEGVRHSTGGLGAWP
jgi:hypothetical protein